MTPTMSGLILVIEKERENNMYSNKLKELRKNKGVTQVEVANSVRISKSSYSAYELGVRNPRDDVKTAIANYFGVTVQYIFFD